MNNEERTVEQAGKSITPNLQLKQFRYLAPKGKSAEQILTTISHFNPNKEVAYVRSSGSWNTWNADRKVLEASKNPLRTVTLLRRDEPDVGAAGIGGGETGVCYSCDGISGDIPQKLQEIFANPHASILEALVV